MGDPAEIPTPRLRDASSDAVSSPLELFGGLDRLSRTAGDAIVVTDVRHQVAVWNPPAAELYGITEDDALGRSIEDLYDSSIAGQPMSSGGARRLAIEDGHWRGQVIDRPKVGSLAGAEVVLETTLSRLDDDRGELVGIIGIKRDASAAVRNERDLATLAALATASSVARSRRAIGEIVLDRLMRATDATMGVVTSHEGDEPRIEASRGLPAGLREYIAHAPRTSSPVAQALRAVGSVLLGPVESLAMHDETRARMRQAGIAALAGVGLHRDGEPVGLLILAFGRRDAPLPSPSLLIQAAAHLQRALDTAQLTEQLEGRQATERRLADQHLALQSLTELSESSDQFDALARRTAEQVGSALEAVAGSYTLLGPDGQGIDWFDWNIPPHARERVRALSLDPATPLRRFSKGDGAFLESYAPATVARSESLELAERLGWTGYAALPMLIAGRLEGVLIVYFDHPIESLGIEPMVLDAIARMASISLGNFRLRERLLASERRYRTMFESSPEPYLVETLDGTIVDANAAAAAVYGGTPQQLIGLPVSRVTQFDGEAERRRREALEHGGATFRQTGIRLDGTTFPEEAIVSVVDLDGDRRALVLVRDLSDQERLQQELIQAQKMEAIGQLVSGVAHELNNPLASILGFSQLIRRDERLPDDMKHHADLLIEEAARTRRIVQNLLDFARQRPPERHPTSIRALVDSVLVLQSYSLGPGRIEVDVDLPADLPPVELDRSQIQQVLVNLTHNAVQAIQANGGAGRLRIGAAVEDRPAGQRVVISIADDGVGVAPQHVDRLFEPFFTTKDPTEGTGLGLPVSLGIIASHGGELDYAPGPDGRGAVFSFDLPVVASAGEPHQPVTTPERNGTEVPLEVAPDDAGSRNDDDDGPRRVLVLDDERSIRLLLEKWLRGAGYEPVVATTGEEALDLVRGGPFDAILCDHRMAGMNGTEVFDAVVAVRPELGKRFVFMSGDVLNPQLRAFVQERGVGLLAKPFDLDTVHRTLGAVLNNGSPGGA